EGLSARNPNRSEKPPSANQPGLPRRKSHFLNRQELVIVKNVAINHGPSSPKRFENSDCSRKRPGVGQPAPGTCCCAGASQDHSRAALRVSLALLAFPGFPLVCSKTGWQFDTGSQLGTCS